MSRMRLLNPGPVTLSQGVRTALSGPDMCHREAEFAALTLRVRSRLERVYPEASTSHTAVLLTGSGTAAVEAMVGTLVPSEGAALVVANGVYGERAAAMLAAHGKRHELIKSPWLSPIDLTKAEEALRNGRFTHVVSIHHETTTGRLNDIDGLGRLCKRYDAKLLLDAVSSFGAEEIRFADWNLEACAATANKCLHGAPGIAFVLSDRQAFARASGARSVYLDLHRYQKDQLGGFSPFTQAVHVLSSLDEALAELEAGGGALARGAEYRRRMARVTSALESLGVAYLLEVPTAYSSVLVSFRMPKGASYQTLHDTLKDAGFVIYAGQGQFEGQIFRISLMGDLSDSDLDELIDLTKKVLSAP